MNLTKYMIFYVSKITKMIIIKYKNIFKNYYKSDKMNVQRVKRKYL